MMVVKKRVITFLALIVLSLNGMGVVWTISTPSTGSSRPKGANVVGSGTIDVSGQTDGIFQFGTLDSNGQLILENEMGVTVFVENSINKWNATLGPPQGGTWVVSHKNSMGMYKGDHVAVISWDLGTGSGMTSNHIVRDQ